MNPFRAAELLPEQVALACNTLLAVARCELLAVACSCLARRANALLVQVTSSQGEKGSIEGTFGKTGRFRVAFPGGVQLGEAQEQRQISLSFKKFVFDQGQHRISQ